MGKRLPEVAANDIVTLGQDKSEVGALALITLSPEKYAAEVYQPFKARLTAAIEGVKAIDYDIKTTAGMAAAVTARATFRDLRVEAENERKTRKAPIISIGKLLESGYNNLEARITPLEELFDGDIQEEAKRKAEVKAAKELAEAERIAAIRAKIAEISSLPAKHARATAAQLTDALRELATREIMKEEFAEQTDDARAAVDAAAAELIALRDAAKASEAAALAAEEARKAAEKRAADEAAAVAAQRAENERVANEHAATAKRLADQEAAQALVAKQLADKAAANLKAEQDALAEQVRIQREAAAEAQRKLDAQQAEFEAKRAAFAREQEEAAARVEAAAKLAADHADALLMDDEVNAQRWDRLDSDHTEATEMNAQFDVDRAADLARCTETAKAMHAQGRSLITDSIATYIDAGMAESEMTDEAIADFGAEYNLRDLALIERLEAFTVQARADLLAAA